FSGFLGKLMLLQAVTPGNGALVLWPVVLVGGLGMVIALSRAGSTLFWRSNEGVEETVAAPSDSLRMLATLGLLLGSVLLVVAAQPVQAYVQATAAQLFD